MARDLRNAGASVRARLLEHARTKGADFQILLTRYAIERLLYRLSVSDQRDRFVLKGAMLFSTWVVDPFRPTRDLDLLGIGDPDPAAVAETFRTICRTAVPDDGVIFNADRLAAAAIREHAEYGAVRVKTSATIAGARIAIQVDIGFGDIVTPAPVVIAYPTLLDGPVPNVCAYPVETVVAEKFQALVALGVGNTRLKDFYDLWFIAQTFDFDRTTLTTAVHRTFERRRTQLPTELPTGLGEAFAADKAAQWIAFLTRESMAAAPQQFATVVTDLRKFLMPFLGGVPTTGETWRSGGP